MDFCNAGNDGRVGGNGCPGGFCGGGRKPAIDPRGVGVRVFGGVRVCLPGGVGVRDGGRGGVGVRVGERDGGGGGG